MNVEEMVLPVTGMHCNGCAGTVGDAAKGAAGVADARVDLAANTVTVTTDGTAAAGDVRAAVTAAVATTGYAIEEDGFS